LEDYGNYMQESTVRCPGKREHWPREYEKISVLGCAEKVPLSPIKPNWPDGGLSGSSTRFTGEERRAKNLHAGGESSRSLNQRRI